MTDTFTNTVDLDAMSRIDLTQARFCTEETRWGYIVRTTGGGKHGLIQSQTFSLLIGAALLAATIGMWLIPGILFGPDALIMRLLATIAFVAAAAGLLLYANGVTVSEIQIDNSRGEIREVTRNHAGKMSLMACYSFDAIGGVYMEPAITIDTANLVLRYRNSSDTVPVAYGAKGALAHLCDRISRDITVGTNAIAQRQAKIDTFKFKQAA